MAVLSVPLPTRYNPSISWMLLLHLWLFIWFPRAAVVLCPLSLSQQTVSWIVFAAYILDQ